MKALNFRKLSILFIFLATISATDFAQVCSKSIKHKTVTGQKKQITRHKVTFIELGSIRCVPCIQMQPIMKSIKEKYGAQVKVLFYDVWTPLGKTYGDKYTVQLIPTQVFLDKNGKEFFRHEGFFPEKDLVKVLKSKGVK